MTDQTPATYAERLREAHPDKWWTAPMTDPQTPATEAGRRYVTADQTLTPNEREQRLLAILDIEAEARADAQLAATIEHDAMVRADALRAAADAVLHLPNVIDSNVMNHIERHLVLAILDPEPDGHALNPDHIEARAILDPETTP